MGTWGTGILENDNSNEIYDLYFEHYQNGIKPTEILKLIKKEYNHLDKEDDSICDFWFTIALALWETCSLEKRVFNKVAKCITDETDLKIWAKLEADDETIKERKKVLNKFLKQIQKPREKPKTRKKIIKRPPVFNVGDCISFKLNNGNFGGAIVIKHNGLKEYDYTSNTIILTRLNQEKKPTEADFLKTDLMIMNIGDYRNGYRVTMSLSDNFKFYKDAFFLIGQININRNLSTFLEKASPGLTADWRHLQIDVNDQIEFEKNNRKPKKTVSVKKFLNGFKWKFW
jgi:hypothetical protein